MPAGRVPDDDGAKMRRQYEGGAKPSLEDLSLRWGWSPHAISNAIKRAGGKLRPAARPRHYPTPAHLLTLYEGGMTRAQLATHTGASVATIDGMLSRARKRRRLEHLAAVRAMSWGAQA